MTITAKNYAAQAQRASIGISAKNSAHKAAIYMARTLPDAQHFALPDGGKVLDDGLRGLEGTDQLRLPFPVISVEWWSEGSRFCVIATEAETKILMMFSLCLDGKNWAVPDAACVASVERRSSSFDTLSRAPSLICRSDRPSLALRTPWFSTAMFER